MADAEARLLDSSVEAGGGQIQDPAAQAPLPHSGGGGRPVNPLVSTVVQGAENRLVSLAETVGFTVDTPPPGGRGGGAAGGEHANGATAAAADAASPRLYSDVDLGLSKDHWDPLSDARWGQAAATVRDSHATPAQHAHPSRPDVSSWLALRGRFSSAADAMSTPPSHPRFGLRQSTVLPCRIGPGRAC